MQRVKEPWSTKDQNQVGHFLLALSVAARAVLAINRLGDLTQDDLKASQCIYTRERFESERTQIAASEHATFDDAPRLIILSISHKGAETGHVVL